MWVVLGLQARALTYLRLQRGGPASSEAVSSGGGMRRRRRHSQSPAPGGERRRCAPPWQLARCAEGGILLQPRRVAVALALAAAVQGRARGGASLLLRRLALARGRAQRRQALAGALAGRDSHLSHQLRCTGRRGGWARGRRQRRRHRAVRRQQVGKRKLALPGPSLQAGRQGGEVGGQTGPAGRQPEPPCCWRADKPALEGTGQVVGWREREERGPAGQAHLRLAVGAVGAGGAGRGSRPVRAWRLGEQREGRRGAVAQAGRGGGGGACRGGAFVG